MKAKHLKKGNIKVQQLVVGGIGGDFFFSSPTSPFFFNAWKNVQPDIGGCNRQPPLISFFQALKKNGPGEEKKKSVKTLTKSFRIPKNKNTTAIGTVLQYQETLPKAISLSFGSVPNIPNFPKFPDPPDFAAFGLKFIFPG